jgi:hypothetical protein
MFDEHRISDLDSGRLAAEKNIKIPIGFCRIRLVRCIYIFRGSGLAVIADRSFASRMDSTGLRSLEFHRWIAA